MLHYLKKRLAYLYFHYELVTCIYMFEPWERKLINGVVIAIICLLFFSIYVYLSKYTETLIHFLSPAPVVREVHM
uniref:Putative serine palmitoyltransferase small subunit a-like protein n=1 Tax=Tabanus bromius TaxID=304241 RepID=A0A0K8TLZ5_TABBR